LDTEFNGVPGAGAGCCEQRGDRLFAPLGQERFGQPRR
jgi:hypothetical protein